MIKKIISVMIAAAVLASSSCLSANAIYVRTANIEISNCRTHPELRENDKTFVRLKYAYITVEGELIYGGIIFGAEDYDIFGDDEVRCKVQSNGFDHYAVLTTDKGNSASDDVKRGYSAYTKWVKLAGGNGDKGWADFGAGFIVR